MHGPSEDLPMRGPSKNLPMCGPSKDLPMRGPSEDLPMRGPSEDLSGLTHIYKSSSHIFSRYAYILNYAVYLSVYECQ